MVLRPPISTHTNTLFPYTTLVRSDRGAVVFVRGGSVKCIDVREPNLRRADGARSGRTCGGTAPRIAGPLAGACGRSPAFRRSLRCRGRVVASGATPRYRPRHATARRAARLLLDRKSVV